MAVQPYLVQIVWNMIENFIEDWQKDPLRWAYEIDIQAELYSRLSTIFNLIGKNTIIANYPCYKNILREDQKWNRVCCEPKSYYKDKSNKYVVYPDIVVWDDIKNKNSSPELDPNIPFPMLWACEIKIESKNESEWDINKLNSLIDQNIVQYACWLDFVHKRAKTGNGIDWKKQSKRLWTCKIMLPSI